MSAVPVTTKLAHGADPSLALPGTAPGAAPSGEALAEDFRQTYGECKPQEGQGGHYNRITKQWEADGERPELPTQQNASTFPEGEEEPVGQHKPSFKEQVFGNAKKFAGKTFGKDHEVAIGEALLQGKGKDAALAEGERVKGV